MRNETFTIRKVGNIMDILHGNAIVGQSGGPTAAINATLAGVIRGALDEISAGGAITRLYGMRNGVDGLLREDIVELDTLFAPDENGRYTALDRLTLTPAAALGSCRRKLPAAGADNEAEVMDKLFAIFAKYDIRYFFYIFSNTAVLGHFFQIKEVFTALFALRTLHLSTSCKTHSAWLAWKRR